ncbi:MAG: PorV/PorQ family protein [Elusimicrobia bacterium]|nr:PorV/PorQ family protein [Elusimicrobiota bacterium]
MSKQYNSKRIEQRVAVTAVLLLLATGHWLLVTGVHADAGKSGGQFIRIVQSPRASAMGDSGAGLYGDILGSIALNPAGLSRTGYREIAFVYNSWIEGISMQQIAYAHPFKKTGTLAFSVSMLNISDFPGYDNSGAYAGDVKAGDILFQAGYASRLKGPWNDRRLGLFCGAGVKYARETLEAVTARTTLLDFGFLSISRLGAGFLGLGISMQSMGSGFKFDSEKDKSPSILNTGLSYITMLWGDPFTVAFDFKKPNDGEIRFSAGLEFLLKRIVAWRIGYVSDEDLGSGLRFGAGFNLKLFQLDYALSNYDRFGSAHRFGMSYKFGKPVETLSYLTPEQEKARWRLARAEKFMEKNRYYEAVLELNEALKLEPNLQEALDMMKKARILMETHQK